MTKPQVPSSLSAFRALVAEMPRRDEAAAQAARAREAVLTKPAGALGRLEPIAEWAAAWQGRHPPAIERIRVVVFAANHGVAAQGVSAYPAAVTAQMVANFEAGGAAINALSGAVGAALKVVPLHLEAPTGDITVEPAMSEAACVAALGEGMAAVEAETDLLCLGEMGIGNTTAAAALCAALFGGDGTHWAGPGTGVDAAGLARKRAAIDSALAVHADAGGGPMEALRRLGGRELAAIAGAVAAARYARIPVLLDGFVCAAGAAALHALDDGALGHCLAAHRSAEPGHGHLLQRLGMTPLLELGMRLGEASGAALAAGIVRAAVRAHGAMATFAEAGVSERDD